MKTKMQRPSHSARKLFVAAVLACGFGAVADGATFNVSWDGGATGSYNTAVNWSTNTVPVNADVLNDYFNVTINRAGGALVTANLTQVEVLNLTIGANAGNQLTLADNCTFGVIGTAAFGPTTVSNAGTIQLGVTASAASQFNFLGSTTSLTGGGTISLIGANAGLFGNGTVTSNNVVIGFGNMGLDSMAWVNNATVTASGGSLTVDMGAGGFDNNGLMQAIAGGTLVLSGNGGGSFANGGGTIANNGGRVQLVDGVTLAGGIIQSQNLTGTSIFFVPGTHTATLSNLTSTADVNVATTSTLNLTGTITNNGRLRTNNSAGVATFNIGTGTVTLGGTGSLLLGALTTSAGNLVGSGTVVNSVSHSIFGAGTLGNGSTTIRNDGLIEANLAGATLTIRPEVTGTGGINTGTIQATAGTLSIVGGAWSNVNGDINAAGGTIVLDGASIFGGLMSTQDLTGASVIFIPAAGSATLEGVSSFADVVVSPTATLHLEGAVGNNGRIRTAAVSGVATYSIGASTFNLNGLGSLALSTSSLSDGQLIGSGTLVNGTGHSIVVTAGEGTLGDGSTSLRNNGTISLPNSIGGLTVVGNGTAGGVVNTGTMTTSSPLFVIRNVGMTNSGTVQALSGGGVELQNSTITGGTVLIASGGELSLNDPGSSGGLASGTLIVGGEVLTGNGVLLQMQSMLVQNNGVIRIGNAAAADFLQFNGGTTILTGAGAVALGTGGNDIVSGNGIVHNQGNQFAGTGTIGLNDLTLINDGTILAANAGEPLNIDMGAGGLTNTGVIRAVGGASLRIRDTAVNNTGGDIVADTGNIDLFNNTSISGGTLSSGTGLFFVPGSSTASLADLTNSAVISISSAATGTLALGGTVTNHGQIRVFGNAAVNVSGGTTTLAGTGGIL